MARWGKVSHFAGVVNRNGHAVQEQVIAVEDVTDSNLAMTLDLVQVLGLALVQSSVLDPVLLRELNRDPVNRRVVSLPGKEILVHHPVQLPALPLVLLRKEEVLQIATVKKRIRLVRISVARNRNDDRI